jgi:hypothetical protein
VASEGAWGAASLCLSVLFAGLLAMNFFEPLATFLESNVSSAWATHWDVIALVGLFALFIFLLRTAGEYLQPRFLQLPTLVYEIGRWSAAALTGYVTIAFLLTALHTAPLPREFMGFRPERNNFFNAAAPDRQWLGFVQYVSEHVLRKGNENRIFDGPQYAVPTQPNTTWPTFPLRYAMRRQSLATGTPAAAPASGPAQPLPPGGRRQQDF